MREARAAAARLARLERSGGGKEGEEVNGDGRMPEDYWVIGAGSSSLISELAPRCVQGKAGVVSSSEVVKVRRGQVNGRVIIV